VDKNWVHGSFLYVQEMIEAGVGQNSDPTRTTVVGLLPQTFSPPTSSCKFVRFVEQLVAGSTVLVFVAIGVDRFYAIVHPLRYEHCFLFYFGKWLKYFFQLVM
jgi:hypothetical protein